MIWKRFLTVYSVKLMYADHEVNGVHNLICLQDVEKPFPVT